MLMFIHNNSYPTDLHLMQSVRFCLLKHYRLDDIIQMEEYIRKYLQCIDVMYNSMNYTFYIKVRKSTFNKKMFSHDPLFYKPVFTQAMCDYFINNEDRIIDMLNDDFPDPKDIYDYLVDHMELVWNLFNIYCISGYTIELRL